MKGLTRILDCTLRDGGYVNNWKFGRENIKTIIRESLDSGTDIVELGFLEDSFYYEGDKRDYSFFTSTKDVDDLIEELGDEYSSKKFCVLSRAGKLKTSKIKKRSNSKIHMFRVAMREGELGIGFELCRQLKQKGYAVSVQPVGYTEYSNESKEYLFKQTKYLMPDSFYLVDTLGVLKQSEFRYLFSEIIYKLGSTGITIGYHGHENRFNSALNAYTMITISKETRTPILIDCSIGGLGRGSGNLEILHLMSSNPERYSYKLFESEKIIAQIKEDNFLDCYGLLYHTANLRIHPNYVLENICMTSMDYNTAVLILEEISRYKGKSEFCPGLFKKCLHTVNSRNKL